MKTDDFDNAEEEQAYVHFLKDKINAIPELKTNIHMSTYALVEAAKDLCIDAGTTEGDSYQSFFYDAVDEVVATYREEDRGVIECRSNDFMTAALIAEHDVDGNKGAVNKYFGEKEAQVDCGEITAFGIKILSRYSKSNELIEMLNFCQEAAKRGISSKIERIIYDSQCNCCSFEFSGDGQETETDELKDIALKTISQFEWVDGRCFGENTIDTTSDHRLINAQMLLENALEPSPFKKKALIWGALELIQSKHIEERHGGKFTLSDETQQLLDLFSSDCDECPNNQNTYAEDYDTTTR